MQLPLSFLLLFFLFLFAHRIKTSSGENIGHSDNVWDNTDNEVEQLSMDDNDDQPSAGECSKSQFQCVSNGKCIEKYMFCDYIVDCEDGSDEIKCGTCNFQNGSTCGWKDASGVKDGWKVVNGNFMTTPPVTQFGHFKLTSPNLHGIGYFCQMVLHINIASKNAKTKLYVAHQIPNSEQNFRSYTFKDMIQKQDWTEVVVPIRTAPSGALSDNHGTYTIDIGAMLYDAGDKITIKEIHFENCNPKRTIGDCDFEDNNLCHWNLNKDRSVIPWIIGRGDQVNETYAPTADHTLGSGAGHFVWTSIGSANSSQSVPVAVLTSIPLDFRVCVSFWYFMDGASFLQLSITDQIVSSNTSRNDALMSSPTGAMWRYKQADIMYRGATFMVNIEAQIEDASGVIAIDDILMKFGGCTNSPICDFETDSCGFQLFKSDNSTWQRIQSRTMQNLTSMTFNDHTTGTLNGYMMLFIPRTDGDMSWFTSPESDFSGYRCLTFYYFLNVRLGGTIPTMIVELAQLNDNNTLSHMELAKIDGKSRATDLKQREWNKHTVTVNTKGNKMMLQFGGVINERDQFIALDDISLTPGACTTMKYKQFPCVANPKAKTDFVNYSKVCDFFSDCPNGADEQNCGYKCLISNPTCGWTVKNVTSTFLRVDLSNPKGISFKEKLPIRDHGSLGSGSYMQLYDQPGPFIDNPEANIESPWLQNTGPLCYFTIFYIIRDPHHESALLRVRLIEPNNPLGIEVFRDEGPTEGYYWKKADIVVGRIRGKFKIQINAQMKIVKGGAAMAIDDIELHQSECMIPVKAHPSTYRCSSKPYHCADKQFCFGEDNLCDYQDDCGDASDESPKYCETKNRVPLQCDFEDGICFWRINSHLNKTHLNGMRWGAIDDIDDYTYGIKRDHTLNNELGHVLYVWNEKKSIGRIESPLIQTNSSVTCQLRLFYLYKSKEVFWFTTDVNNKIGKLNVHIKSTLNGALFKLASVSYVRSSHFERLVVDLNMLKEPFYVVLEVVPGSDKYGIWAIDDVSFSSGCQPADSNAVTDPTFTPFPVTTTSPNQCFNGTGFLCDKEVCIYANQVCDFSRDCNDGTDESNCGEDSFATGWTDQSQGRLSWNIDKKKGEVRSKVGDGIDSVAFMQSVKFGASGGSCSVMFNYFIDMNSESLSLNLVYTKGRLTKHAVLFNSRKSNTIQYNTWNLARIFIGEHEDGWQLQFVGRKEVVNNRTETIRLKNVKFSNCAWATFNYTNCDKQGYFTCDTGTCISKSQICDYNDDCGDSSDEKNCKHQTSFRCSFESSRNVSGTCGLGLTDNKWKRFQGIDTRNFMGPGLDHTTDTERGHFMMVTGAVFGQSNSATQMETPTFDPDSSGNCHIRFWYMINGIGTLTISENVTGSSELKMIQAIDSTPNDTFVWRRFSEPLKSNKKPYKIVFSAKIADIKTKTFIAIDDISFTSACKHSKIPPKSNATTSSSVPHCSIGDQFECLDGSCITFDEVCDFYPTCPQGEDELDCPAFCDFENATVDDLCMWGTNSDDPNPLLIGISRENADSASELALFYPPTDNTLKTSSGHFMFVYGLNYTYQVEPKLDLNILSAEYTSSSSSCMLSLDYYIAVDEGRNATATYVIALDEITDADGAKQYSLRQINIIDETLWNNWTTISVGIGRRENVFQLSIIRLHDPNMPESLAIDNIRFTNCAYTAPNDKNHSACRSDQFTCGNHFNCIPKEQVCDLQKDCPDGSDEACAESAGYELTFEAADGLNSTGFTVGKPFGILGDDVWNIVSGQAPQRAALETGPPFDHTYFNYKGHYLYTRPWDFGVDVWFISPMLKPTKQKCVLRFYYYMFGLNDNQINVYVRNQTQLNTVKVSTIKTKSQDIWRSATVQLQSPGSIFQFIISGVSGGDVASIAIDDVLLTPNCVFDDSKSTLPPGTVAPGTGTTLTTQATTPTATPSNPGSSCDIGLYACADNTCLPQITKCNFIADCSDGSDENAPDCTQQTCEPKTDQLNKECGMNIFLADGSNYTWAYSNSDNFTQQTNVHFVNMFSKFIYVDLSTGNQDDYSNLVTQMISETSPSCMLKFEYACDPNNCPLQVSIISHKNNADVKSLIWVPLNSEFIAQKSGYQVKEARIYIGRRNSFKVSIGSLKQQNVKSYVLLNEIKFENCLPAKYNSDPNSTTCTDGQFKCSKSYGNCIAQSAVCDYQQDCRLKEDESSCDSYIGRCNFENVDVCDFWQYEESDDRWTFITESGQHGIAYLPSVDHTGHTPNQYYLSFHSNLMSNYLGKKAPDQLFGAKIVSNIIMANVTNDCRFRFWYNLIGPNCQLKIYKRYSANENTLQQTVQSDMFDYWQKMELKLQETSGQARDFQIVIQALVGLKQPCSVNVDDVSFSPQCTNLFTPFLPPDVPNPNTTFGNLCKPNLMCHDKKCYSLKQRCNFVQDCDDGTDEESCPSSCTFDYDGSTTKMCGWYNPKGLQANFARTKGPSVGTRTGGTGPKADHTKGTADGYYIVARNFSTYNAKIQLHSPYFSTSGPNCRFYFAYFLNEPKHLDKINIFLKTATHPTKFTKIWTYDPVKAYTKVWNQDSAYVGKQKAFSLILEATQGLKNSRADLAFDDFQFINCHQQSNDTDLFCAENEYRCDDLSQCIDYWRLCDGEMDCADGSDEDQHCTQTNGTCWFVDQNWKTHCNWVDLKKDFNFVYEAVSINATKDKETNTGPQTLLSDIYGYALMKAKGHKLGERAAIASPEFPASSGICSMSFHYYMYGSDSMGELTVYTLGQNGKRVDYFHITGNQGSQWNYVDNIMVGNPSPFRVVFEGIVGADQYSDIAIGYTSFSKDCAAGTWQEKANANLTLEGSCKAFYCHKSHECISRDWVCDGVEDCRDGTDEVNCTHLNRRDPKQSSKKALIITFSVLAVILAVAVPGLIYGYNRYVRPRSGDRAPFLDNSTFETTSHRDLDYTKDNSSSSKSNKTAVSFEMTTRRTNLKSD